MHAPIIVIDTSKQNDSVTASPVDIQLEIEASESLLGLLGLPAYCLLIHYQNHIYVSVNNYGYFQLMYRMNP
ncbi:Uncharacterized protein FWK35_00025330 [Aphis craccivora]|uniref:Double jelly roll-like domain-containing protein n=1 Tax=Aphis craccivora TaxID=307492 RepID=A0A6G0Y1C7_APHCR|nr:Uncharacterized protein FWK35_00025330 [Aphis craccivora]